jgi:hypothetical protein
MVIKNNVDVNNTIVSLKKRGRKSKKELEIAENNKNNINVIIEESKNENENETDSLLYNLLNNNDTTSNNNDNNEILISNFLIKTDNDNNNNNNEESQEKPLPKKRGRKPKGGKIIQQSVFLDNNKETKPNIILHLKCSLRDLETNSLLENNIESFNFSNNNQLSFNIINDNTINKKNEKLFIQMENNIEEEVQEYDDEKNNKDCIKDIWKKLKILEHNLHINNVCDKKSACFWCTHDFDNPPIYIPKHFIKDSYEVYGCFCSPECATAYLMEEHIDSSSKFERYYLLNNIYAKIYNFTKNIKPAPNPYYMLDKYYGNLTIQEYRSLLRNERLFLVVDKPLTRIFPELHEDNDDFIINNKIIPSNASYHIKKKLSKKQTKNNILSERFGLNQ